MLFFQFFVLPIDFLWRVNKLVLSQRHTYTQLSFHPSNMVKLQLLLTWLFQCLHCNNYANSSQLIHVLNSVFISFLIQPLFSLGLIITLVFLFVCFFHVFIFLVSITISQNLLQNKFSSQYILKIIYLISFSFFLGNTPRAPHPSAPILVVEGLMHSCHLWTSVHHHPWFWILCLPLLGLFSLFDGAHSLEKQERILILRPKIMQLYRRTSGKLDIKEMWEKKSQQIAVFENGDNYHKPQNPGK